MSVLLVLVACGGEGQASPKTITAKRKAMLEKLEENLLKDISPDLHPIFEAIVVDPSAPRPTATKYFQVIKEEYSSSISEQEEALHSSCTAEDLGILNRGTDWMNDGIDLLFDAGNEFWMELGRAGIRQEMLAKMAEVLRQPKFESTISGFKRYFELALNKPSDTEKVIRDFAKSHGVHVQRLVQSYFLAIDGNVSDEVQIIVAGLYKRFESRIRELGERMQAVKPEGLSENCKSADAKITERIDARIKTVFRADRDLAPSEL